MEEIKKALGRKSAQLVQNGMVVGLGTGSTATFFIESLIERCKKGLHIHCVSSSLRSLELARKGGIPIVGMDLIDKIDLTVDGADQVDDRNRLIKGGGGAHVREKILASSSSDVVIIVDESKLVKTLGNIALPVEILPFGYTATLAKIERYGYLGSIRKKDNSPFVTDNGNWIFDITTPKTFPHPEQDHQKLISIPGVIDTGFFFDLALRILVGYNDGKIAFRRYG